MPKPVWNLPSPSFPAAGHGCGFWVLFTMCPTRLAQPTELTPRETRCPWTTRAMLSDVWVQRQRRLPASPRGIPVLSQVPWELPVRVRVHNLVTDALLSSPDNFIYYTETTLSTCGYHQFDPLKSIKCHSPYLIHTQTEADQLSNMFETSELVSAALGSQAGLWSLCFWAGGDMGQGGVCRLARAPIGPTLPLGLTGVHKGILRAIPEACCGS